MVASQKRLVTQAEPADSQVLGELALFNEDGTPFVPGGGASDPVSAADITDSTAVGREVLTAANAEAARTALSAASEDQLTALESQVTTLESQVTSLGDQIAALEARVAALEAA